MPARTQKGACILVYTTSVSRQQKLILEAAMTATSAFKPMYIVQKTGLTYNIVSPQLDRLVTKKYLLKTRTPGHLRFLKNWGGIGQASKISEKGRNSKGRPNREPHSGGDPRQHLARNQQACLNTNLSFKTLGERIGVAAGLVDVITDHTFSLGNCRHIKWVCRGLSEMAIRDDIRNRWRRPWSSHVQKRSPLEKCKQRKGRLIKERRG